MFEQDIFISYGWSGNARDEGAVAWVETLRNRLRVALRNPRGEDPKIFWDGGAARTGALTETLERAIDASRLFLFVVSPASCKSEYCPWEIHRFLEHARCVSLRNEVLLPEDRLFGVTLEPVLPAGLPQQLQPLVFRPYNLTRRVPDRDAVEPVAWDHLADSPGASAEFSRLHADLAGHLKTMQAHEHNAVESTGVRIFLGWAATPTHEKEYLRPLRRDLLMRGHSVVRGSPAPLESEESYRLRLEPLIGKTALSVHLLTTSVKPAGFTNTVGLWQLKRTDEDAAAARFIWEDPEGKPDESEQKVALAKGDQKLDKRQTWNDLQIALFKRANELRAANEASRNGGKRPVLIAYCTEDLPHVEEIVKWLKTHFGFFVQRALTPGTKQENRNRNRINRDYFKEFDALLVYYSGLGSGQEEWLASTCQAARRAFKESPTKVHHAALVLHPPPPDKRGIDHHRFKRLERVTPTDFDEIDRWASELG